MRRELDAAISDLEAAADEFAKLATADFRIGTPKAFQTFSEAFCAGLVALQVEIVLRADGCATVARVLAVSQDGRKTTLSAIHPHP